MEKFIIAFDLHSSFQDPRTVDAFFDFKRSFRPTINILGGDIWDLTALRSGASGKDYNTSLADDFKAGADFVKRFKPTAALFGNHEDRMERIIQNGSGPTREYSQILMDNITELYDKMNIKPISYDKRNYYQLGNYRVIHGSHCGIGAIRTHAMRYGGNVIHGHVHAPGTYSVPSVDGFKAYSAPCMCQVDYEYNKTNTTAMGHRNGWIYGIIKRNGKCEVNMAVKDEDLDTFTVATNHKEF